MKAFKPHVSALAPYPYEKVDARVKLDQNESPYDLPPELKERALERLRGRVDCVTPFFLPAAGLARWRVRSRGPVRDPQCRHCSGADYHLRFRKPF